jgi:hypothetical protein
MKDDALAAIAAAARLLLARADIEAPKNAPACWAVAARMRPLDAGRIRLIARFRSRWAMIGRLHD